MMTRAGAVFASLISSRADATRQLCALSRDSGESSCVPLLQSI